MTGDGERLTRWLGAMALARIALNARAVKSSPAVNRQARDRAIIEYRRTTDLMMVHLAAMDDAGDLKRIEALLKEGLQMAPAKRLPKPATGPLAVRVGGAGVWAVYDRLGQRVSERFEAKADADAARKELQRQAQPKPRRCLCCAAPFDSEGAHNRRATGAGGWMLARCRCPGRGRRGCARERGHDPDGPHPCRQAEQPAAAAVRYAHAGRAVADDAADHPWRGGLRRERRGERAAQPRRRDRLRAAPEPAWARTALVLPHDEGACGMIRGLKRQSGA